MLAKSHSDVAANRLTAGRHSEDVVTCLPSLLFAAGFAMAWPFSAFSPKVTDPTFAESAGKWKADSVSAHPGPVAKALLSAVGPSGAL